MPGGDGGNPGMPGGEMSEFKRYGMTYVSLNDEKALEGKTVARTFTPQRMIIVNAAFPYKLQLDRVREALRLASISEVYGSLENVPVFTGVNVQRRVLESDGKTVKIDWAPLAYQDQFRKKLYKLSNRAEVENTDLSLVKLDPSNGLWMWLPGLMPGNTYPEVKLPSLLATIKKFKDANRVPAVPRALRSELGEGDIFAPPAGDTTQPGGGGGGGGAPGMAPGDGMIPGGGRPPVSVPGPGSGPGSGPGFNPGEAGGLQNLQNGEAPDSVLIRILDTNIDPGYKYQYRIQVKMKNPNFGKKTEVSRPSDADIKELTGEWVEMKDAVAMPPENHVYAVDSSSDRNKTPKEGQALLQYQRWMQKIDIGTESEPVGDWVVADVLVTRGQFVGGKQMSSLPLWSATDNRFRIEGLDSATPTGKGAVQAKGIQLDPTTQLPEKFLVVDIDGGRRTRTVGPIKKFDEDVATETLVLDVNSGKLKVFNSAADRDDRLRKETEEKWRKWILEVETNMRTAPAGTTPAGKGGNGRFGD